MESLQQSLDVLTATFTSRMDDFEEKVKKSAVTVSLSDEFSQFRSFVLAALKQVQAQLTLLSKLYDHQEMRSRQKILLVHGVQEEKQENTGKVLMHHFQKYFKDSHIDHIKQCHRIGRLVADKPRPILVKFVDLTLKNKIWSNKSSLKGTGITLSEFLTKGRHDLFMAARKLLGLNKCWTHNGSVFILNSDGAKQQITNMSDLNPFIECASVTVAGGGSSEQTAKTTQVAGARPKRLLKK